MNWLKVNRCFVSADCPGLAATAPMGWLRRHLEHGRQIVVVCVDLEALPRLDLPVLELPPADFDALERSQVLSCTHGGAALATPHDHLNVIKVVI